jgi:hypothetical protein
LLTKQCSKCKEVKLLDMFYKQKGPKSGRTSHCKACKNDAKDANFEAVAAQKKAWYEANKDVVLAEQKADRQANPDKYRVREAAKYVKHALRVKRYAAEYQRRKPEINRRAAKRYRSANPHLGRAKTAYRRAAKLQATPCWANSEFEQLYLVEVYHLAQLRSQLGNEYHVDHIVPLISEYVCGLHCAANLRVIPAFDNLSKGNKYWPDMP